MKFSISQAENSKDKEEYYKNDCFKMAKLKFIDLRVEDDVIYGARDGAEFKICQPINPKTFWYESWLILKHEF